MNDWAFNIINAKYVPFKIVLFACYSNTKCKKYISCFPDPFAYTVDAFTIKWEEYFYVFSLLTKVIRKIIDEKSGV